MHHVDAVSDQRTTVSASWGRVTDCKHEGKNGAWQISGGVECELTQACNILYFCKEAGVHHVDAVSDQRTTISASLGYVRLQTGS